MGGIYKRKREINPEAAFIMLSWFACSRGNLEFGGQDVEKRLGGGLPPPLLGFPIFWSG